MGENVGSQDQIWAAFGGLNLITFAADGTFDIRPITMAPEWRNALEDHIMLMFTGLTRMASDIAGELLRALPDRTAELMEMREMVGEGVKILTSGQHTIADFGRLLHQSWTRKRGLAKNVSNGTIDEIYQTARSAGALGGKLLGAGGGGFMLLIAPPELQPRIRDRLRGLIEVNVKMGSAGSRIVVYEPDGLESR
jgi:D-glycero-alpha-D-manno-heptose-7-phosphate kinase